MKVFVYGTLRQGFHNHRHYMENAEFLGFAHTVFGARLYGQSIVPYLKLADVGVVYGEIYEIDFNFIPMLDRLEGHPDVYRRESGKFKMLGSWEVVTAFYYYYQHEVTGPFFYNYEQEQMRRKCIPAGGPKMRYCDTCENPINRVSYLHGQKELCPYCFNLYFRRRPGDAFRFIQKKALPYERNAERVPPPLR